MFDIRNRKYMVWVLVAILVGLGIVFIDLAILPYHKTEERIEYYGVITQGRSKTVVGYRYVTNRRTKFSIDKDYVRGEEVILKHTLLFKQVVHVNTPTRDYTSLLSSGFNGFTLVLMVLLACSTLISLVMLARDHPLTVNQYQNYVLLTFFVLFCVTGIWFIFN